jgi:hypothetical protein
MVEAAGRGRLINKDLPSLDLSFFVPDGSGGFTGLSQFNFTAFPIADAILTG